jgi:hypothetical protein
LRFKFARFKALYLTSVILHQSSYGIMLDN